MTYYSRYNDYATLYARYLEKQMYTYTYTIEDLSKRSNFSSVLDLCCGGGRFGLWACKAYIPHLRYVMFLDQDREMLCPYLRNLIGNDTIGNHTIFGTSTPIDLHIRIQTVERFLKETTFGMDFDLVFCGQAVNYWFTDETIYELVKWIKPCGVFAFNTFNTRPPLGPVVKEYKFAGTRYVEVTTRTRDMIYHVQVAQGVTEPRVTSFRYISPSTFRDVLSHYFKVRAQRRGRSTMYVCTRK